MFIAEPEHNVPGHQPQTAGSEPAVERLHSFSLSCLSGAVQHARVSSFGTVHEPGEMIIYENLIPNNNTTLS